MNKQFDTHNASRRMSSEALLALGGPNLAFIKRIVVDGAPGYSIHGPDGTILALADDRDVAFAAARQHDLEPVSAH